MDNLDFKLWSKAPSFTVEQAAFLSIGINPNDYLPSNHANPTRVKTMLLILINAITSGLLPAEIVHRVDRGLWASYPTEDNAYFYKPSPKGDGVILKFHKKPNWSESTVTADDLKKWLNDNGLTNSPVFFGKENEVPDYLNEQHPRYAPKLAAAVKVWLAMEDPNLHKGKSPKAAMSNWLESRYSELGLIYQEGINNTAIEECTKVANWNDKGGATKTP